MIKKAGRRETVCAPRNETTSGATPLFKFKVLERTLLPSYCEQFDVPYMQFLCKLRFHETSLGWKSTWDATDEKNPGAKKYGDLSFESELK